MKIINYTNGDDTLQAVCILHAPFPLLQASWTILGGPTWTILGHPELFQTILVHLKTSWTVFNHLGTILDNFLSILDCFLTSPDPHLLIIYWPFADFSF